ncbi:hypothetical protein V8C86DRAFT_2779581, partial [Haematococcus lacustris]
HAAAEDEPQLAIWLLFVEPLSVAAVLVFSALRFFRCGCSALAPAKSIMGLCNTRGIGNAGRWQRLSPGSLHWGESLVAY